MPVAVASDFFRRIQERICSPRPPEETQAETTSVTSRDSSVSTSEMELESTFEDELIDMATSDTSSDISSSSQSFPHRTLLAETSSESEGLESAVQHRSSVTGLSGPSPDVNAQAALRRRILEIQALTVPEREKARRVQVGSITRIFCLNRLGINDRGLSRCSETPKRLVIGAITSKRTHRKGQGHNIS